MKKFIVLSIVLLMLAGFVITASAEELVVGRKHILVGELTVEVVGVNLVVTYTITDPEWELLETHLYVGTVVPTKSAPGQFPYGPESEYATDDGYSIPLSVLPESDSFFIAAQAEIGKIDEYGAPVLDDPDPEIGEQIKETTWAEGDEIRPEKNWAMYFTFTYDPPSVPTSPS
jgi:hypothetical protein